MGHHALLLLTAAIGFSRNRQTGRAGADALLQSLPPLAVLGTVGLLVMLESLGIPLPGETVLIGAAMLSTHPAAPVTFWEVGTAGVLAAIVGDSLGYAIGHRWGDRLIQWLGRRFPRHVTAVRVGYVRHLLHVHGSAVVFAGRFVALLRMLSGPLPGSMRLPYRRFLAANAAGGMCGISESPLLCGPSEPLRRAW